MTVENKRLIAWTIMAMVVIGSLALVKLFPFWVTLCCVGSLAAGFISGYIFRKPEIITEIKEIIKEVPVTVKSRKSSPKKA